MLKKFKILYGKSIFLKIVLIFIVGHILFSFSMMGIRDYIFHAHRAQKIYNTAYNYANLIIDKIGTPPDTAAAAKFADVSLVSVRITNDTLHWASNTDTPFYRNLDLEKYPAAPDTYVGFDEGLHVQTKRGDTIFLISLERKNKDFIYFDHLLMFSNLLIFTIVLIIMYYILKHQLKPIKIIQQGVENVGRGEFDHKISVNGNDELKRLGDSFNNMSSAVRDMIKSREQLLLDVSHELRSPITRVKVALEFLDDSEAKNGITSDIKEIETMIKEILETERLNSPYGKLKKEKIDIIPFLQDIITEYDNREPGIVIKTKENYNLYGDPERLKIVFRNVFENGLKYSQNQSQPVEIKINQSGNNLVIEQKDFGVGIPKEHINYIFEPFYRVDKSRSKETGGYGLGLHLTKNIIEAHSGEIKFNSDINNGVKITIIFPAA